MGDLAKVLYERFFLRDLLGKVAPGYFAMLALFAVVGGDGRATLGVGHPGDQGWLLWVSALPAVYMVGLALQVLGEFIGLHSPSPKPRYVCFFKATGLWREANADFDDRLAIIRNAAAERLTAGAREQRERFVVLKEASGNAALSILVVLVTGVLNDVTNSRPTWVVLSLLAAILLVSHFLHGQRQARFEINVLRDVGLLTPERAAAMAKRIEWRV